MAYTGPGTNYITPSVLKRAPTGIDWTTIPDRRSSPVEQAAEQSNLCLRATGIIDGECNQVLRATLDTEFFTGPDWRVTIQQPGNVGRIMCSRWPILDVIAIQVAPGWSFPRAWTTYTSAVLDIEKPPLGLFNAVQSADTSEGGQAVLVAPGVIDWSLGRNGYRIQLQYVNGWPHTSITAGASAGDTTIQVDDCTGWVSQFAGGNLGATAIFYDGMQQEVAQCSTASTTSGPGILTLSSPLTWPHEAGTLFTTLPATIMNAAIDYCTSMALERGATATTIQSMSGGGGDTGGPISADTLRKWAAAAVSVYARVI